MKKRCLRHKNLFLWQLYLSQKKLGKPLRSNTFGDFDKAFIFSFYCILSDNSPYSQFLSLKRVIFLKRYLRSQFVALRARKFFNRPPTPLRPSLLQIILITEKRKVNNPLESGRNHPDLN